MIKGVNRQMIEVTHTGSPYFERAFLVVRGEGAPSEEGLHRLAEKVVRQAETYAGLKQQRWRRHLRQGVLCVTSAAAGAGLLWLVLQVVQ